MPEENVVETVEAVTETVDQSEAVDQHGAVVPDNFSTAYDEVMSESSEEVSEDVDEDVEESAEAEEGEEAEVTEEVEDTESEEVSEETEEVVEQEEEPVVEAREEIEFELDEDLVDPSVKAALDKLKEGYNQQQKAIDEDRAKLKLEQEKVFENRIDSCFDKYNEDLPTLGSTSKLSKDNGLYRRRLFQHAQITAQMDGISIEEAIKDTVQMYKNKGSEKTTEKKLITKLNKQKTKFSNPPTRKNKSIDSRKFATENDRARAVMDKAYADAGIN